MRAIIYSRVSLDKTGEGLSVQRQEGACEALCRAKGWEVVGKFTDNSISAYSGKERPGWAATLRAIEQGEADAVVVWALDRAVRSMSMLEEIIEKGIVLATATGDIDLSTDTGRLIGRILAAVARAEVERKGERQRLSNEQRANSGQHHTGRPPRGYDNFMVQTEEAPLIREAGLLVLHGGSRLEAKKFLGSHGIKVTRQGLNVILTNPAYAGFVVRHGEIVGKGNWQPIFSEDEHYALSHLVKSSIKKGERRPKSLATNLAHCSCGGEIKAGGSYNGGPATYRCRSCSAQWNRDEVDQRLINFALFVADNGSEPSDLDSQRKALEVRLEEAAEAFAAGAITIKQLTTTTEALRGRLEALNSETLSQTRAMEFQRLREAPEGFLAGRVRAMLEDLAIVTLKRNKPGLNPTDVEVRRRSAVEPLLGKEGG